MGFKDWSKKTIRTDRDAKMFYHYSIPHKSLCEAIAKRVELQKDGVILVTGATGCLSEDTIVGGQSKSLGELYKSGKIIIDTVSMKQASTIKYGSYYPIKSKSEIIDSGIKEVYEIELEDGRKVFATEEHKLFKINKNSFNEEIVKNLKVGDYLKCYTYKKHFEKDKTQKQSNRDAKYSPKRKCKKCGTLFYEESTGIGGKVRLCKSCLKKVKHNRIDKWFEWEDNLIRQFYCEYRRDDLMNLLSQRKWKAICHRAKRINIKRNTKFQREPLKKNAFSSIHNPMYSKECREKSSISLRKGFANGTIKLGGIALKSKMGLTKKENHPNWLGGISFEPYDSNWDNKFKTSIRLRDNYKCNRCGRYGNTVHHIDYNKKNSTAENCITLCNSCHVKTNYNRPIWEKKFKDIMIKKCGGYLCTQ